MSNKGKHTSKKPFGAHLDARTQKSDSRKIHQMTFDQDVEKEDIEIPDEIELPKEREIPNLSNSSSGKPKQDSNNKSASDSTEKSDNSFKGRHIKSAQDKTSPKESDDASPSKKGDTDKIGKHSQSHIASIKDKEAGSNSKEAACENADENGDKKTDSSDNDSVEASDSETVLADGDAAEKTDANDGVEAKSFDIKGERFFEKHPKAKKKILIATGSVVGAVAAIYLLGVALFSFVMYPMSNIDQIDTSIKTPVPIQEELASLMENYTFTVKGQGMDVKLSSKEAGIEVDCEKVAEAALESQNPWAWPYEAFIAHDNSHLLKEALTINSLEEALASEVETINASAVTPTNAYIQFNAETATFEIIPEVAGSILDLSKVLDIATGKILELETAIVLGEEALLEPTVLSDDSRLLKALEEAISILGVNPQLSLNGANVYTIDASVIGPWVQIGEDFSVGFNSELMGAWSDEISKSFNTIGKSRTYTRPDGKVITVSGGTYGWKVDTDNLLTLVNEAFSTKTSSAIEMPVTQSGTGFDSSSGRDWGARYVDIDISEQYARFYDENAALIWESPIVSGAQGKTDTPTGVYTLNPKGMNVTLRGPMKDGEYEWESKVKYWMPFKGNSVGLHDAPWQSAFGGSRFKQGFGSHGCVNLPSGKASELYNLIHQGDVVVVHY